MVTKKKTYKPQSMKKAIPKCKHPNLQVLEYTYGKYLYTKGNFSHEICDWSSNAMGAHRCRVDKYWCPDCNEIIKPPKPQQRKEI